MESYYQTFSDKFGFLEDLSVLDLICNKGPESLAYIKKYKTLIEGRHYRISIRIKRMTAIYDFKTNINI